MKDLTTGRPGPQPRRGPLRPNRAGARLFLLALFVLAASPLAARAQSVTVRVKIERVVAKSCLEPLPVGCQSRADFYAKIAIDGEELSTENRVGEVSNRDDISPDWELSRTVELSRGSVPVKIELWDRDGVGDGAPPDDRVDVDGANGGEGDGRNLNLTVRLSPCAVEGDVSGGCDTTLTGEGTTGDRAQIQFRVIVKQDVSGLRVRCMHTPALPQGSNITITAEALDDTIQPRAAEEVRIFVEDRDRTKATCSARSACSFTQPASTDAFVRYGCEAVDGQLRAWSGWRMAWNGAAPASGHVPVLTTGPRSHRIDIVFIPDRDDYSGADAAFISDVEALIRGAYFTEPIFLDNQNAYNFWIATDTGDAEGFKRDQSGVNRCDITEPAGWNSTYSFSDLGVIVHKDNLRDCAPGGKNLVSTKNTSFRVLLHETGHRPFGLADEYCCDGGYFEVSPHPNLYKSVEACRDDAPGLNNRSPDACRSFTQNYPDFSTWLISEPASNDLMSDNGNPNAADQRRIRWLLNECMRGRC